MRVRFMLTQRSPAPGVASTPRGPGEAMLRSTLGGGSPTGRGRFPLPQRSRSSQRENEQVKLTRTKTLRGVMVAITLVALIAAAAAYAAKPKAGKYEGKVAAGYGGPQIQLTVKGGKVKDLIARMFYSCNNGPQEQTVVAPSRTYRIKGSGAFKGKSTESIGGVASETVRFEGHFTSATKATGTIRSQTVGGGETCDTQERKFTVKRK